MPKLNHKNEPKKTTDLPLKVSEEIKEALRNVAVKEDRPVGYVARELMIRGLLLYYKDKRLKASEKELTYTDFGDIPKKGK